ncbi:hypothetical protein Tco_0417091 [Tanacetum coccineum]
MGITKQLDKDEETDIKEFFKVKKLDYQIMLRNKDSAYEILDFNEEAVIIAWMTWIRKIQMKLSLLHPTSTNIDDVLPVTLKEPYARISNGPQDGYNLEEVKEAEEPVKDGKDFLNHQAKALQVHNKKLEEKAGKKKKFKFGEFGVKEWEMMFPILKKKKNKVVPDLINSLDNKYDELRTIREILKLGNQIPLALLDPSKQKISRKKRKVVEP